MAQPTPLTEIELDEYNRLVADDLSGEAQTAMRQADAALYEAWLDCQLRSRPMPSHQKPDINGLREGDHVSSRRVRKLVPG